jgi:ATP-dependent Clp protease ATP-binding subunit ClpA
MRIWSAEAKEIMNAAREKASAMGHAELDPLHLLWAFLREAALTGTGGLRSGMEPIMAIRRIELELAALPQAVHTVATNPNAALRNLFLRAADLAAVTNNQNEVGRVGPHELVLALVGDPGPAGDMLQNFEMRAARMVG